MLAREWVVVLERNSRGIGRYAGVVEISIVVVV
jgi:hypothetical protein